MPAPFLTAQWRYLAMLNYRVDPELLKPLVPAGTELDLFAGHAYVSLVGFLFLRTRVLGLSIPWHRDFEEVNLRFYVRRRADDGTRRGVVFIKEIVPRWAVATVAWLVYNENYVSLPMRHSIEHAGQSLAVRYEWRIAGRWQGLHFRASGLARLPDAGSKAEFITEHYWGYRETRAGRTNEYRVEHPRWHVWQGEVAGIEGDLSPLYGPQFAAALDEPPASAFLADGSAIAVGRPVTLRS
jgi:uncharacterized protein YqjF (DUF2071 family)